MKPLCITLALLAGTAVPVAVHGGPDIFEVSFQVDTAIPDGSLTGLADTREVLLPSVTVASLTISLALSPVGEGGFIGDLFATLRNDTGGYAVLLNRPGRRPGSASGYSDGGALTITLADAAPADVHQYRITLNGSEDVPLGGDLTGLWQPDGRAVDPLSVVVDDPRGALLSSFAGLPASGNWTLFLADLSGGGGFQLDSWGLTFVPVPEPSSRGLLGLGVIAWWLCRRSAVRGRTAPPGGCRS